LLTEAGPAVEDAVVKMVPEVASRTPALFRALLARLKQAGFAVGNTAQSLIDWVKKEPVNAATAAVAVGSLGIDIFKDDPAQKSISTAMQPVINGTSSFFDHAKVAAASSQFETLKLNLATNQSDLRTAAEILRWARGFFGSSAAAQNGHTMLQAFLEMPQNDVAAGFDTLRV